MRIANDHGTGKQCHILPKDGVNIAIVSNCTVLHEIEKIGIFPTSDYTAYGMVQPKHGRKLNFVVNVYAIQRFIEIVYFISQKTISTFAKKVSGKKIQIDCGLPRMKRVKNYDIVFMIVFVPVIRETILNLLKDLMYGIC